MRTVEVNCKIVVEFSDTKKVKSVLRSIKVDDFDFVKSKANGKRLEAKIKTNSISSLIHTLDDYLSCVSVAIKVLDKD